MPSSTHLRYDDADSWLADRERATHGLGPKHGQPLDDDGEPVEQSVPDADQGGSHRGSSPGAGKQRSADAWLMEVTDEGRGEHAGDSRHYDDLYGS